MSLPEGAVLDHYRIVELIGAGGMAEVYLAEDIKLERRVALKLLPSKLLSDPGQLPQLKRQAELIAALLDPNQARRVDEMREDLDALALMGSAGVPEGMSSIPRSVQSARDCASRRQDPLVLGLDPDTATRVERPGGGSAQRPLTSSREERRHRRAQVLFVREARLTGQLEHPNIIPVHDIGIDQEGRLFFVMKLVAGKTLDSMIKELPEGPIEHNRLLDLIDVVIKVGHALAFAHSRGVIHCDIKPANVMVGEFGEVYLLDWGIARLLREHPSGLAVAAAYSDSLILPIAGTPSHMSPEQAIGDQEGIGQRSDVFLVGALLYRILTRRPPYRQPNTRATLADAAIGLFPDPEKVVGHAAIPPELGRIVRKAMALEPQERHRSIEELTEDLIQLSRGGGQFPRRVYPADAVIVREGEEGDEAFFVVSGRCRVTVGIGSERRTIREIAAGDAFGETAILSPGPRTATVTAMERTTVEVVTRSVFDQELALIKPWMARFVRTLAERFRDVQH